MAEQSKAKTTTLRVQAETTFASKHPLYGTWANMNYRCSSPKDKTYSFYGGRGITVCPRWRQDFFAFAEGMGERPEGHTLDRIDSNGDYTPENCRWATKHEQSANTRRNNDVVGVVFNSFKNRWQARLMVNRKLHLSRYFMTMEEAVTSRRDLEARYL